MILNMYINYPAFSDYLKIWMDESEDDSLADILSILKYSGMSIEATDKVFSVEGYTNVKKDEAKILANGFLMEFRVREGLLSFF